MIGFRNADSEIFNFQKFYPFKKLKFVLNQVYLEINGNRTNLPESTSKSKRFELFHLKPYDDIHLGIDPS
jgi:hypothetical protein